MSSTDPSMILRTFAVVRKMFTSRNYREVGDATPVTLVKTTALEILAVYDNPRNNIVESIECLFVPYDSSRMNRAIGVKELSCYLSKKTRGPPNSQRHVIVVADSISFKAMQLLSNSGVYWESIDYADLGFHKCDHYTVPKYEILSSNQCDALVRQFGPVKLFPKMIAKVDAMARYLDFRIGDILKITAFSATSGTSTYYREVVDPADVMEKKDANRLAYRYANRYGNSIDTPKSTANAEST